MRNLTGICRLNLTQVFCALVLISAFVFPAHAGSVNSVRIEVSGEGHNYQMALNNALVEAIGQVNGKHLDSSKISLSVDVNVETNDASEYFSADAYQSLIYERTQGAVKSYEILDSNEQDGVWLVELSVEVAKYKNSKSANRKRVVILPTLPVKSVYRLGGSSLTGSEFSQTLDHELSDYLVQTRKYAVLDRQSNSELDKELSLSLSGQTPIEEAARLGQKLMADFIITGKLSNAYFNVKTKKMRTSDKEYQIGSGKASYSYKLIEVATSQIFFSDSVDVDINNDDINMESDSAESISFWISKKIAEKVVSVLNNQIYPLSIIAKNNNEFILSEGGKVVKEGDQYRIYKRGEKIYDPYTGEFSGYQESYCCLIKITRVKPKQSYAVLLEGEGNIPDNISAKQLVAREKVRKKSIKKDVGKISTDDAGW